MKVVTTLVALAALLFAVGGIGTVAAFILRAGAVRVWFMWIFLAGVVPTIVFVAVSFLIGAYHLYLRRALGQTPVGWVKKSK